MLVYDPHFMELAHVPEVPPDQPPRTPPQRPPETDPPRPDEIPQDDPNDIPPPDEPATCPKHGLSHRRGKGFSDEAGDPRDEAALASPPLGF